jgi:hypothetical protein
MRMQATQEGLAPLKSWIKNALDQIIQVSMGEPGLEFVWVGDDAVDPLQQAQTLQILVTAGIKTREEARAELGLGGEKGAPSEPPVATWSYDHDQPRDDNGRWTASGNAADPVGHPARKPQPTGVQVARNDTVMSDAGRPHADVQVAQAPPIEPPPPLPESLGAARPVEGPAKEPGASPSSGTESGPAENPRGEYDTTDRDVKFGSTTWSKI